MRVTIVGPGGVGGYYAAKLKQAGNEVNIIARGKSLSTIRKEGITLSIGSGSQKAIPDLVTDSFQETGIPDLIIVTVKAWQVQDITSEMERVVDRHTTVLPVQNGVETFDILRRKFNGRVLGGLTRMFSYLEKPGFVRNLGGEVSITMGEENGAETDRVKNISSLFQEAGMDAYISKNIRKDLWEKFLIMANLGGIGAVTRAPVGVLLSVAKTRDILAEAINEVLAVGKASGIDLDSRSRKKTWDFIRALPPDSTTSLQRDINAGKPSEIEFLSGSVIRLGKEYRIRTPVHEFIYGSLMPSELRARNMLEF